MKYKVVTGTMLTLLFIGMLTLAVNIQPVKASGTIYIRADGSVEPDTAPISTVDNITYTLTDNIEGVQLWFSTIIVERNNIVVDGAGYTLQGTGSGIGINLTKRNNVTIKNMEVKAFWYGIYLPECSNNNISGNTITNNDWYGVWLHNSSNYNTVYRNNVTNNGYGIALMHRCSNNSISKNNITNNNHGIRLINSSNNKFYHNNFIHNTEQVDIPFSYPNVWDDGVGEGNYWSDYGKKYPDAEEIDGIWDTPYEIDENNQDDFPIVPEFPSSLILQLFMATTLSIVIIHGRKQS